MFKCYGYKQKSIDTDIPFSVVCPKGTSDTVSYFRFVF